MRGGKSVYERGVQCILDFHHEPDGSAALASVRITGHGALPAATGSSQYGPSFPPIRRRLPPAHPAGAASAYRRGITDSCLGS